MGELGLSSANIGIWSGADATSCAMSPAPSSAQIAAAAEAQQRGLFVYDYTADEIGSCADLAATLTQWAQALHAAGVANLVTMAPTPGLFNDGTGRPVVDVWACLPKGYDAAGSANAQALALGTQIWSYNDCVQDAYSPKWEIDFAPVNYRIQPGFVSQSLSLSGLLYWRVDSWTASPWTDVATMISGVEFAGEGMLVYPGANVGTAAPAPSMRLKWFRDGVDDYEYVQLLKVAGHGEWALSLARTVGADWTSWSRDPAAIEAVREQLGAALDGVGPR
jgi:hypothetical protein